MFVKSEPVKVCNAGSIAYIFTNKWLLKFGNVMVGYADSWRNGTLKETQSLISAAWYVK